MDSIAVSSGKLAPVFSIGQKELDRAFGFFFAEPSLLKDAERLSTTLAKCLTDAKIEIYTGCEHKFPTGGEGVTAVRIIGASCADIHTWPEHSSLILRVFACGDKKAAVQTFIKLMLERIKPKFAYEFKGREYQTSIPKRIPSDWLPLTDESRDEICVAR